MQNHMMKRQRGRGRKPPGHQPNRNFESTGPDVKIRGSASHVYEKYMQLARDAYSSGDRVMAENYTQHAEHYFRILKAMQPQHVAPQFEHRFDQSYDMEAEDQEGGEGENEAEAEDDHGPEQPQPHHAGGHEGGEGGQDHRDPDMQRQRRRRRSRFRTGGDREGGGGGPRPPREQSEQPQTVEGFGQSAPAFLSND